MLNYIRNRNATKAVGNSDDTDHHLIKLQDSHKLLQNSIVELKTICAEIAENIKNV